MGAKRARSVVAALLAAVLVVSCTSAGTSGTEPTSEAAQPGGTLRLAASGGADPARFDPLDIFGLSHELHLCCLLRRLYSYPGMSAGEGGTVVQPDLASGMPEMSADGLTWTIEMQEGLRYAPPYEEREIVAEDVVEGLERLARSDSFLVQYLSPVGGFDRYATGEAEAITGLNVLDEHTLSVQLTSPTGDLPHRLALDAAAPIPPGSADGHDEDFFLFLPASGPYMLEGAGDQDPSLPPDEQLPPSGWRERSITLVRNPSWDPATDDLREAYPDRIRIELAGLPDDASEAAVARLDRRWLRDLVAGRLDVLGSPFPQTRRLFERRDLPGTLVSEPYFMGLFVPLNLAAQPFDDVHVRRAVNLVVDRAAIAEVMGEFWEPLALTWHIVPSALEGLRLPDGWQPSWAEGVPPGGDLVAARREMARSRYDSDGDGRCDRPACTVRAANGYWTNFPRNAPLIARAFERLGIVLDYEVMPPDEATAAFETPGLGFGFVFETGWAADFPSASTYFVPLLYGPSITEEANMVQPLIGADPDDLARWGYPVTSVPSIDDRIERCMATTGEAQIDCWTELDVYTSERIVPWIPLAEDRYTYIVSPRVLEHSFDVAGVNPSFDSFVLAPRAEASG